VRSKRKPFHISNSDEVAKAFRDLAKEVRESFYVLYLTLAKN